ncbi:HAD family hydrolase [Anaerosporobacter faecicola]|uniref:HAD family hydrolase n=1 Tax=Anaerosporobacter faecicola TaxID=2718714 RepID=UPI001439C1AA|nr:HAD family hydrolase [Anaerosporobacter faecicola]
MENIKYIFFDIGYTLVNEDDVWEKRCQEQAATVEAMRLGLTKEIIYKDIVDATILYKPQYRTVVKKYNFREIAPYRHNLEKLYDDTIPVLKYLSNKYKLGIIANQSKGLEERLDQLEILQYFTDIISSWDYQLMKPDEQLFKIGLKKSNYKPYEVLMVGDRLDNDIYPAKHIGMKAIWIQQGFGGMQTFTLDNDRPDKIIKSLTELFNIL